uniref:hypothetical protein n=1 Tax=Nocardiopsis valliformis TaxID=239974 RepID=UPI00034837BF|nr:hypothetical protein [Nocardiopsis valliformis]
MATLRNTAIGLLRAAGFNNIAGSNHHMIRDEARSDSYRPDFAGALGETMAYAGVFLGAMVT